MKLIALEEHLLTLAIRTAWQAAGIDQFTAAFDADETATRLEDLGPNRIALMDAAGIDVQVLSLTTPALSNLQPQQSIDLAQTTNDLIAQAIRQHPTRFQGFRHPSHSRTRTRRDRTRRAVRNPRLKRRHALRSHPEQKPRPP